MVSVRLGAAQGEVVVGSQQCVCIYRVVWQSSQLPRQPGEYVKAQLEVFLECKIGALGNFGTNRERVRILPQWRALANPVVYERCGC